MHLLLLSVVALQTSFPITSSLSVPALQEPLLNAAPNGQLVRDSLKAAEVIPDVLDDFEPSFLIKPYYPPGKRVELGNRLKPQAVARRPIISVSSLKPSKTVKSNTTYTVVLSDPDATSRAHPVKAQMCHWIISQIIPSSASHGHTDLIDLGTALSLGSDDGLFEIESYFPPAPPPKTGYHRYVFALLTSDSESLPKKPKDRPHWGYGKVGAGIREWARENELEVVGANFFYARNKKQ